MKINDAEKAAVKEVLEILDTAVQKLNGLTDNAQIALIAKLIHVAVMSAEILI